MTTGDDVPRLEEIEKQFKRVLASRTFARLPRVRPLLERLSNDYVAGKAGGDDYETTLAVAVFGKKADWEKDEDNIVRQTMRNLRIRLKTYYKTEGSRDEIEIAFPPWAGYAARSSYRRIETAPATAEEFSARFSLAFPDLTRCETIVGELEADIRLRPSHAPYYAFLADFLLTGAMCCCISGPFAMPVATARATEAVRVGMRLRDDLWHLHVMAGALHCCRFAWDQAEASFDAALRLAPPDARAHLWYMGFLLAVGRRKDTLESLSLRESRAQTRITPYLRLLFSYLTRDFERGYTNLQGKSPLYWGAFDRKAVAGPGEEQLRFESWPAEYLAACFCFQLRRPLLAEKYVYAGGAFIGSSAFLGMQPLMEMNRSLQEGDDESVEDLFGLYTSCILSEEGDTTFAQDDPISKTLVYMGGNRLDDAFTELHRACDMGHPLTVWLHLWPIFDPLRDDPRFKKLIERMNLPKQALLRDG